MITALAFAVQVPTPLPTGEIFCRVTYFLLAGRNNFRYIFGCSRGRTESKCERGSQLTMEKTKIVENRRDRRESSINDLFALGQMISRSRCVAQMCENKMGKVGKMGKTGKTGRLTVDSAALLHPDQEPEMLKLKCWRLSTKARDESES